MSRRCPRSRGAGNVPCVNVVRVDGRRVRPNPIHVFAIHVLDGGCA